MPKIKTGVLVGKYDTIRRGEKYKMPKIYVTWSMMKQRCLNPRNSAYKDYGAKAIIICDRWLIFENFYNDVNSDMEKHIEIYGRWNTVFNRVDSGGNYEPSNCKWVTRKQQCNNMKSNRIIEINGVRRNASQWIEETGINVASRLKKGCEEKYLLARCLPFTSESCECYREFFEEFRDEMRCLPERWLQIIIYRFGFDNKGLKSLADTGRKFNISGERVRQLIKKSMEHIDASYKKHKD